MKYILLLVIAIGCLCALPAAQISARYIKTDTANYPLLISSVQVLDSSDEPVKNLTNKNFKVIVDAKAVDSLRTTTYEKTGQGLHIILVIDASGTMKGEPIASIKAAILPFIDKIRSVDKVAVAVYADDYQLLTDFTSEKELLKNTINSITPQGKYTSLYYGANKALQRLISVEDRTGKIMILMGDGKDENPTKSYTENDIIKTAQDNGVPIFTIGYSKVEEVYLQSLERIAESTGGSYYYAPRTEDLAAYYDKLYRQIMNINLLSYMVAGIAGDGAEHNLGIAVKTEQGIKDLTAKFTAPAGRPAYTPGNTPIRQKRKLSPLIIGVVLGILLILGIVTMLLVKRSKKQKQAQAEEAQRLEAQKNREQETERQKRVAVEQELNQKAATSNPQPVAEPERRTPEQIRAAREHTMIMGGNRNTIIQNGGGNTLRMEIIFGSDAGKVFTVDASGATLGRAGDNRIVLTEKTVSSHHARISFVEGYFVIEDVGSTNGVLINGNKTQIFRLEGSCTFKMGSAEGNFTLL